MSKTDAEISIPRIGMLATVRNRRGVISGVQPFDGPDGRLHLVDVEYNDGATPLEQSLLWEREPYARVVPPGALPDPTSSEPMSHADFDALVRACRWSARMPFIDPDGSGPMDRLPVSSPFHGAVQIEDYQLVPLLKAIRMPRVSLLIADDVGLGKTIEAGLILSELLLRRRVRRVLILTPAALRDQWQEELWEKFSLNFDIVDRDSTIKLRRQVGMDANPWRSYSRVISSYYYLKQPDVLEQFRAASEAEKGTGRLPWDLLIVDEAHNLSPVPFGEESDLTKMLRQVSPLCEHRLFLTATPHNGHTRSFTGLLELLDPVRFSQTAELKPAEHARVQDVLVRRLKREINERSNPKKFADRLPPQALIIDLSAEEKRLSAAFGEFRSKVISLVNAGGKKGRLAGTFAVEILGKRLLSCPLAFADSWHRCRAGMRDDESATDSEVLAAKRSVSDENDDDREAESLNMTAALTVGAWLKPMAADLEAESHAIDHALEALGLEPKDSETPETNPKSDSRYAKLLELVRQRLQNNGQWRDDERLIVFTEYKTTLDYVARRLREDLREDGRILTLFGGMDTQQRKAVKQAFNDPDHAVRILVATDAASEGLNLQKSARYLLHYDVPWNPSRLEQRNGRLDRHGQSRDVSIWHFASDDDQDLKFLHLVVNKVDSIREDLGATGEVFDELAYSKLITGVKLEDIQRDLDAKVEAAKAAVEIPRDDSATTAKDGGTDAAVDLSAIAAELDLDAESMRETLDSAMAIQAGRPRLGEPDDHGRCKILQPVNPSWSEVIDDSIRMPSTGGRLGALPSLVFDAAALTETINDLPVFKPRPDVLLMHLAQPLVQRALTALTRLRFPGGAQVEVSRWTLSHNPVPDGCDGVIKLTFEELGINELRETFHHWVRTVRIPVVSGAPGELLEHQSPMQQRRNGAARIQRNADAARDIWLDAGVDLRDWLAAYADNLSDELSQQLEIDRETALEQEGERYRSRQGEVSSLIESSTMTKLERELDDLRARRRQGLLFSEQEEFDALDRNIDLREEELKRRKRHYEEVREQLAIEREHVLNNILPKRFAMRGEAQVLPISVEIVLPEAAS